MDTPLAIPHAAHEDAVRERTQLIYASAGWILARLFDKKLFVWGFLQVATSMPGAARYP